MEAIALLEEVVAKDDARFGAHHYLIHAYEGSKTPEKAWHANAALCRAGDEHPARRAHAGSHLRAERQDPGSDLGVLGRRSDRAEVDRVATRCIRHGHHGHNVHFLIHALNLGGRYEDSMKWVQHLFTFKENPRERNGNSQRGVWRQGYFGLIKSIGAVREVERDPRRQDDPGLRQAGAARVAALGDRAWRTSATGQLDKAKAHARRDAEGSRRGDLGEGTDRHRAAGARGDDRGARRRPQERLRAVPQGGGSRSGDALHRAAVVSAAGRRRAGQRRAGARRLRDRREGLPRNAGARAGQRPRLFRAGRGARRLGKTAEAREARTRAAKAWARADSNLPQVQALRTSTAAAQQ